MDHPLTRVLDRVVPDAQYRAPDLAELLGLALSSTNTLILSGWFPGAAWERAPGTDRRRVWTGAALIAAADTDPPALDHSRYTPSTLWRLGCGCDGCLAWHNADSRQRRRAAADAAFPEQRRRQVLELVSSGDVDSIEEAAARAKVSPGRVFGLALRDQDFRAALDEAAVALCVGGDLCGRPIGYRTGCRGTACRRAHRPLATPPPHGARG
ncbi:hypothetical protein [Streptomyces chartreusis]|uniref:Uncharacterized protein n=1 Tax=Streptomyces chartreusis TaxID=1969 RepID=A0A7H8TE24_STRCX|nr:hypothetical protein [Streptomyces chartreusis]QKZ20300.1 hypothetical protein HUT05_24880 [Streptomyces chartreusis]